MVEEAVSSLLTEESRKVKCRKCIKIRAGRFVKKSRTKEQGLGAIEVARSFLLSLVLQSLIFKLEFTSLRSMSELHSIESESEFEFQHALSRQLQD